MVGLHSKWRNFTKPFLLGFENSWSLSSFFLSLLVVKWHRRIVWTFSQRQTISCPYGWHTDIILLAANSSQNISNFLAKSEKIDYISFKISDIDISLILCWQENVVHVTDVQIDTTRRRRLCIRGSRWSKTLTTCLYSAITTFYHCHQQFKLLQN